MKGLYFTAFMICLSLGTTVAACHVVTVAGAGSKSGSDWNNACAGFTGSCVPGSMVRGDSYYLGAGVYTTTGVDFNKAVSGSQVITIKGANATDNCTATGWNSSLDTSTSPAHFVSGTTWTSSGSDNGAMWAIDTSYWTINGNNCSTNQIKKTGQGILLDNSAYTPTTASGDAGILIDSTKSGGVGSITVSCVEVQGMGMGSDGDAADFSDLSSISCNSAGTQATVTLNGVTRWFPAQTAPDGTRVSPAQVTISGVPTGNFNASHVLVSSNPSNTSFTYPVSCTPNATANSGSVRGAYAWGGLGGDQGLYIGLPATAHEGSYTFSYVSLHDALNTVQINGGTPNGIFDHNYYARNFYIAPDHAAAWTFEENSGNPSVYVLSNSAFTDIESTAWIVDLYGANVNGHYIYGNTFAYSPNNPFNRRGVGNAVFSCINSNVTCTNVYIYNNSVVNVSGSQLNNDSGVWAFLEPSDATASNWYIEDNLAWNSNAGALAGGATPGGTFLTDYNTYLNSPVYGGDNGSHSSAQSNAVNPFVSSNNFNFQLSSETIDPHLNDGATLTNQGGQMFNIDGYGITRGADGTWERGAYEYVVGDPPAPPSNLMAVPK